MADCISYCTLARLLGAPDDALRSPDLGSLLTGLAALALVVLSPLWESHVVRNSSTRSGMQTHGSRHTIRRAHSGSCSPYEFTGIIVMRSRESGSITKICTMPYRHWPSTAGSENVDLPVRLAASSLQRAPCSLERRKASHQMHGTPQIQVVRPPIRVRLRQPRCSSLQLVLRCTVPCLRLPSTALLIHGIQSVSA
nr:hypothetical protein CFP56_16848 [Quercus suber]